jgi:lipoyl-dependent peroxiredoxin
VDAGTRRHPPASFARALKNRPGRPALSSQGEGFVIDRIALTLNATVAGIDEARFQEIALTAKHECPLSKALEAVAEISLQATLGTSAA